jgi:hypothetical protein
MLFLNFHYIQNVLYLVPRQALWLYKSAWDKAYIFKHSYSIMNKTSPSLHCTLVFILNPIPEASTAC